MRNGNGRDEVVHNITERDGLFCVRTPAWHGLGTVLAEYPTREEAQRIALPWEPEEEPVYRRIMVEKPFGPPVATYVEIEGSKLITRSDNQDALSVVNETLGVASNSSLFDIAEAIEGGDAGSVMYETGGSLLGGRKVWLLLRLRDPILVKGDPRGATIPYYALQNAHDGDGAFRGQGVMTRIVCDNTSHIADLEARARGTEFVFRHTAGINERIAEAKVALAGWRESIEVWRQLNEVLIDTKLTDHAVVLFIEQFIPMPAPHTTTDRVIHNVEKARAQLTGIINGATIPGEIRNTAYGLTQAAIEYVQHERRAKNSETKFKRAYLDRSDITTDAMELARSLSNV